eukprot:CAMPEP_0197038304 /NCGR_PEP_ID=MMETSP1384-20130603/15264_1 /TAXON_ID=29189 /ORGANISM="Ammonia sp." /LENGTH=132 /DNA_ID=CAMNT_0042468717 /DNA_START=144 /DNA_END=542 /DNA_ORIENTATION=+
MKKAMILAVAMSATTSAGKSEAELSFELDAAQKRIKGLESLVVAESAAIAALKKQFVDNGATKRALLTEDKPCEEEGYQVYCTARKDCEWVEYGGSCTADRHERLCNGKEKWECSRPCYWEGRGKCQSNSKN